MFDSDPNTGGGESADITKEAVYEMLRERIVRGVYAAIIAAPPCSSHAPPSAKSQITPPPPSAKSQIAAPTCNSQALI